MVTVPYRKKLIEVALPLDDINRESNQDKALRAGHPGSLHVWWAPRPLPACRAVLFAQFVDDPSSLPDEYPTEAAQAAKREELFEIIREISKWENSLDASVLHRARVEIARSIARDSPQAKAAWKDRMTTSEVCTFLETYAPPVLDPFAGGGRIPLEARRLGLRSIAVDLNPLPVLINEAHLNYLNEQTLSRRYVEGVANRIRDAARKLCDEIYRVDVRGAPTKIDGFYNVWFAKCQNPACRRDLPLTNAIRISNGKFLNLYTKEGLQCRVEDKALESVGDVDCPGCGHTHTFADIRGYASKHELETKSVAAIAVQGGRKTWLPGPFAPFTPDTRELLGDLPEKALGLRVQNYGLRTYSQLYNERMRAVIFAMFSEIKQAPLTDRLIGWLILIRLLDYYNILTFLDYRSSSVQKATGPPTMQMRLGYCEINPLGGWSGNLTDCAERIWKVDPRHFRGKGVVRHGLAQDVVDDGFVLSTDPPYYDMIGYGHLSDQFYIWARELFADSELGRYFQTVLTPKEGELIADPGRHGSAAEASQFFREEMAQFLRGVRAHCYAGMPATIYYSYKQHDAGPSAGAWEHLLDSLITEGWMITASWPIEAEMKGGLRVVQRNSLANCIVLVCRPRARDAAVTTRQDFLRQLKTEMPRVVANLRAAHVQPVDLAQGAIGPGMAIYSAYSKVLEPNGDPMRVREALDQIRKAVDELRAEQVGHLDAQSSWAVSWFETQFYDAGAYGKAETLATSKATNLESLQASHVVMSGGNKVRLLRRTEYPQDLQVDAETPIWTATHAMINALEQGGEMAAAKVYRQVGDRGDDVGTLADYLFQVAESRGWNKEAQEYNGLGASWAEIQRLSRSVARGSLDEF